MLFHTDVIVKEIEGNHKLVTVIIDFVSPELSFRADIGLGLISGSHTVYNWQRTRYKLSPNLAALLSQEVCLSAKTQCL